MTAYYFIDRKLSAIKNFDADLNAKTFRSFINNLEVMCFSCKVYAAIAICTDKKTTVIQAHPIIDEYPAIKARIYVDEKYYQQRYISE